MNRACHAVASVFAMVIGVANVSVAAALPDTKALQADYVRTFNAGDDELYTNAIPLKSRDYESHDETCAYAVAAGDGPDGGCRS